MKNPFFFDNDYFEQGHVPLDTRDVEIISGGLEWENIVWGNQSIKIKDTVISGLSSFKYYKKSLK